MVDRTAHRVMQASLLAACVLSARGVAAEGSGDQSETACLKDHEQAQVLRMNGKLLEARAALRRCSSQGCPGIVRTDCTEWLSEVGPMVPSIILSVTSDQGEETQVRVLLDDQPLTDKLSGKPFELDPGAHDLKIELKGWPAKTLHIVAREGERNRVVEAHFEKEKPPPTPAQVPFTPAPPAEPTGPRPVPAATYIFGALALGAAGAGTYFGVTARQKYNEAKNDCSPNCPSSRTDPIRMRAILADSSFGLATVSAVLSAVFYFTRPVVPDENPAKDKGPKHAALKPQLGVAVGTEGGFLQLRGEF